MLRVRALILLLVCYLPLTASVRQKLNLNGTWDFQTDPAKVGEAQKWFLQGQQFAREIQVPGAWQAQGVGEAQGGLRHNYSGAAWYRRRVATPEAWRGKHVRLVIGGVSRSAVVFVNGEKAGEHDGFSAPFAFEISKHVRAGQENVVAVRIVNPTPPPQESPDVQKSTQPVGMMNYLANWGGIYGDVEIEATESRWIERVAVTPHTSAASAAFAVQLAGQATHDGRLEITTGEYRAEQKLAAGQQEAELYLKMPQAIFWSPETPHLYHARIRLLEGKRVVDEIEQPFGLREISKQGRTLLLNGKPLYLRGYGDDNIEVLGGFAPASKEELLKRIKLARSFGFNAVRFHSMTPSENFFEAADEAGLLVMAELPVAYTMHLLPHRDFVRSELESVLLWHRNHPSFFSLALGNEFNLNWLKTEAEKQQFQDTVRELYTLGKSIDATRMILSNDGLLLHPSDIYSIYRGAPEEVPTLRHEFGAYYCSLPDISLIPSFSGALAPTWLDTKKEWIEKHGLSEVYTQYLRNSERLQQSGRKFQIERARRDPLISGYHYWTGVDFPGGTGEGDSWEEGWFDYFWRPKGVKPEEGRELNAPVLTMIDAAVSNRSLWNDAARPVGVSISNFGDADIRDAHLTWRLTGADKTIGEGSLPVRRVDMGKVADVGVIELPASGLAKAAKLELAIQLQMDGQTYRNHWSFWSFPHRAALTASPIPVVSKVRWEALGRAYPFLQTGGSRVSQNGLLITPVLDAESEHFLEAGGRVWLLAGAEQFGREGEATFFPASGGANSTLVREHPALRGFPVEDHFDLQFFNLVQGAWNYSLDDLPGSFEPIAGGIRTKASFLSKSKDLTRSGYIFEGRVGKGQLLVTTLRIRENFDEAYPEAMSLFDHLLRYAVGDEFKPEYSFTQKQLRRLAVEDSD